MPLGYLATLVATMPTWVAMQVRQDELDLAPPGGQPYRAAPWSRVGELLAAHDDAERQAREALEATSDAHLATSWRLLVAGNVVAEDTRQMVIADTFTHLAHHRGQLSVYLRLQDVPLPSIYGPTADDRSFGPPAD